MEPLLDAVVDLQNRVSKLENPSIKVVVRYQFEYDLLLEEIVRLRQENLKLIDENREIRKRL